MKFFDNYKIMKKDALIVFAASTLGYEAFSKGLRCVSFDHSKYHYDYKYSKSGPFWGELKLSKFKTSYKQSFKLR